MHCAFALACISRELVKRQVFSGLTFFTVGGCANPLIAVNTVKSVGLIFDGVPP